MHTVQACHPTLAKACQVPFHCKQNTVCSLWEAISIFRTLPTNAAPLVLGQLKSWSAFTGNSSFGCFSADVGTAMIFVHAAHAFCKTGKEQEHQHAQQPCVQATESVQYTHRLSLQLWEDSAELGQEVSAYREERKQVSCKVSGPKVSLSVIFSVPRSFDCKVKEQHPQICTAPALTLYF